MDAKGPDLLRAGEVTRVRAPAHGQKPAQPIALGRGLLQGTLSQELRIADVGVSGVRIAPTTSVAQTSPMLLLLCYSRYDSARTDPLCYVFVSREPTTEKRSETVVNKA